MDHPGHENFSNAARTEDTAKNRVGITVLFVRARKEGFDLRINLCLAHAKKVSI